MTHQTTIPRQLAGIGKELAIASIPPAMATFVIGIVVLAASVAVVPDSRLVPPALATIAMLVSITILTKKWVRHLSNK